MKPNRVKQLLKNGEYAFGTFQGLCSPIAAEIIGRAGFDWALFDMEHSPGDFQTLLHQLQGLAAAGTDTVPFVRMNGVDPLFAKKVFDLGAYGVMVPGVRTVEEAETAVKMAKYPPWGFRGLAGNRGAQYGADPDYFKQANDELMVVLQIETKSAIENIDAILDIPGIDVAFLGPFDLSGDYGHPGEEDHPEVAAAIKKLEDAANKRGIALGSVSANKDVAKKRIERGYRFLSLQGDSAYLSNGAKDAASYLKETGKSHGVKK